MQIRTLKDLYIFGLQDMNDGCRQSFETMEAMRDLADHPDLKRLTEEALKAMHRALEIFSTLLEKHGAEKASTGNKALRALADEARELAVEGEFETPALRDLAILSKIRNIAHYPDAGFETFANQAHGLGFEDDVKLLKGEGADTIDNTEAFEMMRHIETALMESVQQ
tara:strand:+ start:173 stop:676 length:504 start_codon:yes stop_codon:yes gene_type:complete